MKKWQKIFWVLWAVAQVAIVASCVYDVIMNKYNDDALFVFVVCQPIMALLPFFLKRHQLGAVINIAITSTYAICCCCERFNSGGGFLDGANWFIYLSILSVLQFVLVALYWSIERIIKVCKSKSTKIHQISE
ncbi:MAG: hypothetical protein K2I26_09705 [Paramuribaculum sp.]|nr:hypothetical protein [Paramuribaculum sp.]